MKARQLTLEQFQQDVSKHTLTISKDDGLYRHLTLGVGDSFNMRYHITTWPGYLCISGDMGCFVFARLKDMFEFHRSRRKDGGCSYEIDFRYWAEKVQAGKTEQFSRQALQDTITELYKEWDSPEILVSVNHYLSRADDWHDRRSAGELLDEFCADCGHDGYETWEYEFKEYTFHFIWACYAIVHAINLYDQSKAEAGK